MLCVTALLVPLTYTLVRFILLLVAGFTKNEPLGSSIWDHQLGDPRHAVPCTRLWQYWLVCHLSVLLLVAQYSPS